jgi:hypothetical protein
MTVTQSSTGRRYAAGARDGTGDPREAQIVDADFDELKTDLGA